MLLFTNYELLPNRQLNWMKRLKEENRTGRLGKKCRITRMEVDYTVPQI